jgi:hypothetical protein
MANQTEIEEAPQWWEVQNIPTALVRELRRRKNSNNIGMQYPTPGNPSGTVYDFYKNHSKYKGPMTPWVRIFSNGTGLAGNGLVPKSKILEKNGKEKEYKGFLFMSGNGFYESFGYKQQGNILKQDKAIIGYEADGTPHYIDPSFRSQFNYKWASNYYGNESLNGETRLVEKTSIQKTEVSPILPPPNLESVEIRTSKDMLAYGSFKFKCYSLAQLEYLAPFFLTPRINVFIELGWNLFNIESLIDLNNEQECWNLIQTPQTVVDRWYKSYGNYGCITGIITKYDFSTQDGQVYNCNVELTSRQALYAGMPAENNVSTTLQTTKDKDGNDVPSGTKEYSGLKTFIKTAFPKIKETIIHRKNFMEYVAATVGGAQLENEYDGEIIKHVTKSSFYGGKKENRIFIGRTNTPTIYQKPAVPDGNNFIKYSSPSGYTALSYLNDKDFDSKNNDDVWLQLDFLFEVVNKFCSVEKNKTFTIDVDKIINAHPNLISCDPSVLIPNGIAPKFNIGKIAPSPEIIQSLNGDTTDNDTRQEAATNIANLNGYVPVGSINDPFFSSRYDLEVENSSEIFKSAKKVETVFKTAGSYRDNLDTLINRLYYDIGGEYGISETDPQTNISFPFIFDKTVTVSGQELALVDPQKGRPDTIQRTYLKHKFGNLKNIYVAHKKIMEISEDKNITTLQQFATAVLNLINDAVDGFWKFQVSQSDSGGLSIVDNNYANLGDKAPTLSKVYVFDVGGTDSFIKSVTLNTSLTSEQATLTLFQAGQNKPINSDTSMSARNSSQPAISYIDRLEKFNPTDDGTGESNEVPSKSEITVDQNPLIAGIQTYGKSENVLMMTSAYVKDGQNPDNADKNYKQLNLPPELKDKLSQIIDDGDVENNLPLYSGISPNFQITVTFDGIFGFRMFQHFGITNLPKPYIPENVLFMITDVTHNIVEGGGKWETVVGCLARCVAGQDIELVPL